MIMWVRRIGSAVVVWWSSPGFVSGPRRTVTWSEDSMASLEDGYGGRNRSCLGWKDEDHVGGPRL